MPTAALLNASKFNIKQIQITTANFANIAAHLISFKGLEDNDVCIWKQLTEEMFN